MEQLSLLEYIGFGLWQPKVLLAELQKEQPKEEKATDPVRLTRIIAWILVSSVFGLYFAFFGFSESIWRIKPASPWYPWLDLLNIVSLFVVSLVIMLLWRIWDLLILRIFLKVPSVQKAQLANSQVASFLPLIPLASAFVCLRFAYGGSYILAHVGWIAIINIAITLIWHYTLWFMSIRSLVETTGATTGKLYLIYLATIILSGLGVFLFFWVGPPATGATRAEFIMKVF